MFQEVKKDPEEKPVEKPKSDDSEKPKPAEPEKPKPTEPVKKEKKAIDMSDQIRCCDNCGKIFVTYEAYNNHQINEHGGGNKETTSSR